MEGTILYFIVKEQHVCIKYGKVSKDSVKFNRGIGKGFGYLGGGIEIGDKKM